MIEKRIKMLKWKMFAIPTAIQRMMQRIPVLKGGKNGKSETEHTPGVRAP